MRYSAASSNDLGYNIGSPRAMLSSQIRQAISTPRARQYRIVLSVIAGPMLMARNLADLDILFNAHRSFDGADISSIDDWEMCLAQ